MEDKSLHRPIAKDLFTAGTGEVTRAIDGFGVLAPGGKLDTDRSRRLQGAKPALLQGSFISADCSHRPVEDSSTHSGNASELQQFDRSLGQWSWCVSHASERTRLLSFAQTDTNSGGALLFENYCGGSR
jgi:hypothetical protein